MDVDKLKRYASLHFRKQALEKEAKEIGIAMAEIEQELINLWQEEEVRKIVVLVPSVGKRTVSINRQLWTGATDGNWARACRAMKESGNFFLAGLVQERFNIQTISAWAREFDKEGNPFPPLLHPAWEPNTNPGAPLTVTEKYSIRVTKGA